MNIAFNMGRSWTVQTALPSSLHIFSLVQPDVRVKNGGSTSSSNTTEGKTPRNTQEIFNIISLDEKVFVIDVSADEQLNEFVDDANSDPEDGRGSERDGIVYDAEESKLGIGEGRFDSLRNGKKKLVENAQ